ncbi:MAG TPA: response regulator [Planctomycetota bacterium]|nr:response regulator [Planctomycetota bacterium]
MTSRQPCVLHVEDQRGDRELMLDAFLEAGVVVESLVAGSVTQALAVLRQEPPFADVPPPTLILLDIELGAGGSGLDLLRILKDDPVHRQTKVIVLTGHSSPPVSTACQRLGARLVQKPEDWSGYAALAKMLAVELGPTDAPHPHQPG